MKDEELRNLLRGLPREAASEGFTEAVLQKVPGAPGQRPHLRLVLAAALVALVAVPPAVIRWHRAQEEAQTLQRMEALQSEYRQLEREFEELQRFVLESQPVVDLGGNEEFDFVLDVGALVRQTPENVQLQPVAFYPMEGWPPMPARQERRR